MIPDQMARLAVSQRQGAAIGDGPNDVCTDIAGIKIISVMPSPLMMALATRWILDGTADSIRRFIRDESQARQAIATHALNGCRFESAPHAFNVWLQLPEGVMSAEIIGRMAGTGVGIMPSDAFIVAGEPTEAIRVCLGGQIQRGQLRDAMGLLAYLMSRVD